MATFILNNDISYRDAAGFGGMLPEKILKWLLQSGAFWCVILIRLYLKKVPLFIIKHIDYSYTHGYTLAMGYLLPENFLKSMH